MTIRFPKSFALPPLALLLLLVAPASAQDAPAAEDHSLGERFDGRYAGITFRPPAGLRRVPENLGEVARYADVGNLPDVAAEGEGGGPDEAGSSRRFLVNRVELSGEGAPLRDVERLVEDDEPTEKSGGLLEATAAGLLQDAPGEMHRIDTVYVNNAEIGVLALEQDAGVQGRRLVQVGLVRVSDRIYYRLLYVVPLPDEGEMADLPVAREAARTFAAVLDSTDLVDLSDVRADQESWLINTRNLLVNWDERRIDNALKPIQWLRVLEDGEDVGYLVIAEERADGLPRAGGAAADAPAGGDGVRVGVRSVRYGGEGVSEREQWSYYRLGGTDRAEKPDGGDGDAGGGRGRDAGTRWSRDNERWNAVSAYRPAGGEPRYTTEIGHSQRRSRVVRDAFGQADADNPGVAMQSQYTLTVRRDAPGEKGEVTRELPEFYWPQALAHLAPRLVPLDRHRTYMAAQWVPGRQEVMARYIEVRPPQTVTLAGQSFEAAVVADRIGLDGILTEHYFDPATGNYLGSETPEADRALLPSTQQELRQIWQDADLQRPSDVAGNE